MLTRLSDELKKVLQMSSLEINELREKQEAVLKLHKVLKIAFNSDVEPYLNLETTQLIEMCELLLTGKYTVNEAYENVI